MGLRVGATSRSPWAAIVLGGVVAGTLDIGAAALINWASPALILRFVAGGLLGKITQIGEQYLTVEIAKGVEVQVQRSAVVQVLPKGAIK